MLTTRLYLECDDCRNPFPACGNSPSPVDGAIFTPASLRVEAKGDGWTRRRDDSRGAVVDLCPRCTKKAAGKAAKGGKG